MKTKMVLISSILYSISIFLIHWYLWDIIDLITPFLAFVPVIIILALSVSFLIYTVVYAIKNIKKLKLNSFIPLLIIALSIILNLTFPFTKANLNLDFKFNLSARNDVIETQPYPNRHGCGANAALLTRGGVSARCMACISPV
jgi:hypothetical protein